MRFDQFYATIQQPAAQPVSQPASADRDTSAPPAAATSPNAISISWIGVLIAIVLIRIVYEVSE